MKNKKLWFTESDKYDRLTKKKKQQDEKRELKRKALMDSIPQGGTFGGLVLNF